MKSFDGKEIFTRLWDDVSQPKGVVQICHGLGEHSQRYDDFARFLNANGYIAFADDHRAHGNTDNGSGDCVGEPCSDTVQDLLFFSRYLKDQYPTLPLIFYGHSYGSCLAQRYIQFDNPATACVMTGITVMPHAMVSIASALMSPLASHSPAKMISMDNDGINKRFDDNDVPCAWLTRDQSIRMAYYNDPYCGGSFSLRFVHSMVKLMRDFTDRKNIQKVRSDLPIGIFCGAEDAAGNFGKGPQAVMKAYQKYGKHASLKMYPGMRHEVLNEINKEEIYNDILAFINSVI